MEFARGVYRNDAAGVARMLSGAYELSPYLTEYNTRINGPVLEIGPLYSPLLRESSQTDRTIFYWDFDVSALAELRRTAPGTIPLHVNLREIRGEEKTRFGQLNRELIQMARPPHTGFRAVVMSQVLNYLDPRVVLPLVYELQETGGLLFINNNLWGEREFRHPQRAQNHQELIDILEALGYRILKRDVQNPQTNSRLLLVAEKT
jgi:hypothetical protein